MKTLILIAIAVLCGIDTTIAQPVKSSIDSLTAHVYYLASDDLKGRDTGSEGQKKAAEYINNLFAEYGLNPISTSQYYQTFHLKSVHKNQTLVTSEGKTIFGWNFLYASGYNHNDTLNTNLVFCGYGTPTEVESLNIETKAVAFIAKTPSEAFETLKELKQRFGTTTFFVLLRNNAKEIKTVWRQKYNLWNLNLPDDFQKHYDNKNFPQWSTPTDSVNIYYCFSNTLSNFFMMNESQLEQAAKRNLKTNTNLLQSIFQPKITCVTNYNDSVVTVETENVAGLIKGIDTTKTLVISAHYDHIGVTKSQINYGADDNASGTAVLLESARILTENAKLGILPQTNILFVAFSAEELGLFGSEAFLADYDTKNATIVGNINMDMVGRWDNKHEKYNDFVYLLTAGNHRNKMYRLSKQINHPKYFAISNRPGLEERMLFKYGSDHYNFLKKDIPIAVFFTGLHSDYHTPKDTPQKINYKNLKNIADVVPQYIYLMSDYPAKPQ